MEIAGAGIFNSVKQKAFTKSFEIEISAKTFSDHKLSNQTNASTSQDNAVSWQHLTGLNFAFKYQNAA